MFNPDSASVIREDGSTMESRRYEILAEIAGKVALLARDFGLDREVADQFGAATADIVADACSGQVISFPNNCGYKFSQRDREIVELESQGVHPGRIAKQFGLTERHIRRIIKRAELRERNLRQKQLFNLEL